MSASMNVYGQGKSTLALTKPHTPSQTAYWIRYKLKTTSDVEVFLTSDMKLDQAEETA